MKKIFALFLVLCLAMITLTGCASGFDGKWDCVEAEVETYGGALSGAYNALANSGGVSLFCEVEIHGDDVRYFENASEYKVRNVQRDGNTITFYATDPTGLNTDLVTLKLKNNGKTIKVTRYHNEYTLQRSDFVHKVLLKIPVWVYIIVVIFLGFFIFGKILNAKQYKAAVKAAQAKKEQEHQQLMQLQENRKQQREQRKEELQAQQEQQQAQNQAEDQGENQADNQVEDQGEN